MAHNFQNRSTGYLDDKCYIPGYTGFCPFLQYEIGKSYGRATHNAIRGHPYLMGRLAPTVPVQIQPMRDTGSFYEDGKINNNMFGRQTTGYPKIPEFVSGYTGYVPKYLNRVCRECGENLCNENCSCCHELCRSNLSSVHAPQATPTGEISASILTPSYDPNCVCKACAAAQDPFAYKDICRCSELQKSPGTPVSCPRQGVSPCLYCQASSAFPKQEQVLQRTEGTQEPKGYTMGTQTPSRLSYPAAFRPREGGVIPHYCGFIPGFQNSIGETYGRATRRLLSDHFARMNSYR